MPSRKELESQKDMLVRIRQFVLDDKRPNFPKSYNKQITYALIELNIAIAFAMLEEFHA